MTQSAFSAAEQYERELVDQVDRTLSDLLGTGWKVRSRPAVHKGVDGIVIVSAPRGGPEGILLIEAKQQLSPAAVARSLAPRLERLRRSIGDEAVAVVVSSWLSPRTRQVLDAEGISYLDLTGNVSLRIPEPAVLIKTQGDQRDPQPRSEVRRGISGPRAGRVVRQLVDFEPPRRAAELAEASGISESYASRLLEVLGEEALIRRKDRVIVKIDWQNLLRARAASYQLTKANHVVPAVARRGVEATLEALRGGKSSHPVLITGTWAANGYVPLVVGGALMLYVPPGPRVIDEVMKELGLMRVPQGTTPAVQLLQPLSDGALERPGRPVDGVPTVGLSQLVLDCLTGPGRLPAAGEALLDWMAGHEDAWREPSPLVDSGDASLD
ncbi:MAG: hypothetical protein M3O70_01980 [Actinomycetota bacterium]|nr:hypothetical protein [Actinomycetota bacterium]